MGLPWAGSSEGELTLLLNDWEAGPAEAMGANVVTYVGYTIDEPLLGSQRMAAALGEMLKPLYIFAWKELASR